MLNEIKTLDAVNDCTRALEGISELADALGKLEEEIAPAAVLFLARAIKSESDTLRAAIESARE